jgi:hypothetical protein
MRFEEEDLKRVRETTIGELIDTLARDDYNNYDWPKWAKVKAALCPILIQARDFFADKNNVCRGALGIAVTAMDLPTNDSLNGSTARQMVDYIICLTSAMLGAKGAGLLPLETLVDLRTIRNTDPDWGIEWPVENRVTTFPKPLSQAAE